MSSFKIETLLKRGLLLLFPFWEGKGLIFKNRKHEISIPTFKDLVPSFVSGESDSVSGRKTFWKTLKCFT